MKKIEEIRKLFNSWLYRHLTPFGRVTIIKTLALSKLTHVALVVPHAETQIIQELESMCFHFKWKNKPDRMTRSKSALPCEKCGLKMLRTVWRYLGQGAWFKLLQVDLLENNFDLFDIWYGGPSLLNKISDKLKNSFWKETLLAMSKIEKKIPCAKPHLFFHLNIFANDLFAVNKTQLLNTDFPQLWAKKLCQVGDFYDISVNPPKLQTRAKFNKKRLTRRSTF